MSRIALCGLAAALATAGLATSSAAAAPAVQADRECYTPGETMTLAGSGFTPLGQVGLAMTLHGAFGNNSFPIDQPFLADNAGALHVAGPAPALASSDDTQEDLTVTATDRTLQPDPNAPNPAAVATLQVKLSTWDVFVAPWDGHKGVPGKRVKLYAYGWEPMRTLWAHYLRGSRVLANVRIGALSAPCGDLTTTFREFPFRPVPAGNYTIYFTGARTFSRHDPWIRYRNVAVGRRAAVSSRRSAGRP